jgi:hypothetical protein
MQTNLFFFIISPSFLLIMRNVSDKSCTENQNTHSVFNDHFIDKCDIYERKWKNIVQRGRPQMTIWRMSIACWIPKSTITHTQVV